MGKLLVLRGLPASGKSTYARDLMASLPKGFAVRVNNDELSLMLYGASYLKTPESAKMLFNVRESIIREAFKRDTELVIVDNTNLSANAVAVLKQLAIECRAVFEVDESFLEVPLDVCLRRNALRSNPVPDSVITEMAKSFIITAKSL